MGTGYSATKSKITSLKTSIALNQCRDFRPDNVHNIHLHTKAQCKALNTKRFVERHKGRVSGDAFAGLVLKK